MSEDVAREVLKRVEGRCLAVSSRKFVETYVDEDELSLLRKRRGMNRGNQMDSNADHHRNEAERARETAKQAVRYRDRAFLVSSGRNWEKLATEAEAPQDRPGQHNSYGCPWLMVRPWLAASRRSLGRGNLLATALVHERRQSGVCWRGGRPVD